jgi:hypothetical protein
MPRIFSRKYSFPNFRFSASVVAMLALAVACGDEQPRDRYAGDTTYQRQLAYQQQMSLKVPTDSLMHLYLRLADATSAETGPLAKEIGCEMFRGAFQYGSIPASRAQQRAFDSLGKVYPDRVAMATAKYHSLPAGTAGTSNAECHINGLVEAPDSVDLAPVPGSIARQFPKRP